MSSGEEVPEVAPLRVRLAVALNGPGRLRTALIVNCPFVTITANGGRFLRLATAFAAEVAVPFSPLPRRIGVKVDRTPPSPAGSGTTRSTWTW